MVENYLSNFNQNNNFVRNNSNYQLDFAKSKLEDLFKRFVVFIDGSPNTVRTYRTSLKQWFKYMQDNSIFRPTPDDVRNYRNYLIITGKKPTTVQNYIAAVKRFFQWTDEENLYPDIARYIKGAKITRNFKKDYLTSQQARSILSSIDQSTLKGKRDYAMLAMMFTMGLRTVEVIRANIEDIRTKGDTTVLYVQSKGHIEKDDLVRMPSHVELAIRRYLSARNASETTDPLFASISNHNNQGRMTTRSIRRIVKSIFISAGFDSPRLTAHSTRHTAATLSLLNGATLQQTQELLRHRNISTTEIYAHNIDATKNPASSEVDKAIFDN